MSDQFNDLTGGLKGRLIKAPDNFADNVMFKIRLIKEGSFRSMPVSTRIFISSVMIVLYCSLGILLGAISYGQRKPKENASSNKALVELMESHHMNSDFLHDQLFKSLSSTN